MDHASLQSEIDRLREQFAALDAETVAAAGAPLTVSVATWRWSEAGSGVHRPEPWWQVREAGVDPGEGWLDDRVDGTDADRVGFDAEGRVVQVEAHRHGAVTVVEVWSHGPDGSRMLRAAGPEDRSVVWLDRWHEPTRVATLRLGSFWIEDEQQEELVIEEWRWEAGWAVEGTVAEQRQDGEWSTTRYELQLDEIQHRLLVDGHFDVWLSDAVIRDEQVIAEALVDGLGRALVAGVAEQGVERPFVVEYRSHGALPGRVRVGGEAFREASRRASPRDGEPLERLHLADDHDPTLAAFSLGAFLDEDTALACREINAASRMAGGGSEDEVLMVAYRVLAEVAERLTASLNEPGVFGETTEPFLARILVGLSDPSDEEADQLARRVLGDERVDVFHASLTSTRPKPAGEPVSADVARADRSRLATWLEYQGIDDGTAVAAAAEPAYRLVEPAAGDPRPGTRLHGPGLLPPDTPWPRTEAGRDLAFLAAIDLSELSELLSADPSCPTVPPLPDAGWFLFFADIECNFEMDGFDVVEDPDEPDVDSTFYGEETPNVEGADARLFVLPAGTMPVDAVTPLARAGKRGWPESRRVARAELTLPDDYDAGARLGLDPDFEFFDVAAALTDGPADWILGAATGVQGHPIEDGSVLLLHLESVEFADGGAIQFRIPPEALAVGDWSQAYAVADSG